MCNVYFVRTKLLWQDVGQPPTPYTYNNYAKMQISFLQGDFVASSCSRMRNMVLDDFSRIGRCSRMRSLVLETSEKASDLL